MDFAPTGDAAIGHDEDGDGVPDELDDCPHVPGPQLDSDGDGVGDACDPEPSMPRQHRALFAAMTPDDQPFALTGDWTQTDDALHFSGNGYGAVALPLVATSLQVTLGYDILADEGTGVQHQLALGPNNGIANAPSYFVELNDVNGEHRASVSFFDGSGYTSVAMQPLPDNVHPGRVTLTETMIANTSVGLDGGWVGEIYQLVAPVADYGAIAQLVSNVNNLSVDLRYAFAVTTDPGP